MYLGQIFADNPLSAKTQIHDLNLKSTLSWICSTWQIWAATLCGRPEAFKITLTRALASWKGLLIVGIPGGSNNSVTTSRKSQGNPHVHLVPIASLHT